VAYVFAFSGDFI